MNSKELGYHLNKFSTGSDGCRRSLIDIWNLAWNYTGVSLNKMAQHFSQFDDNETVKKVYRKECIELGKLRFELLKIKNEVDIVLKLKTIYFNVKKISSEFKEPLWECFEGNELYHLIIQIQKLHVQLPYIGHNDMKWLNKLLIYIEPFENNKYE